MVEIMKFKYLYNTPIGRLAIEENGRAITGIYIVSQGINDDLAIDINDGIDEQAKIEIDKPTNSEIDEQANIEIDKSRNSEVDKQKNSEVSKETVDVKNQVILQETTLIHAAYQQLLEYFSGQRKNFDIPIEMEGTPFQKKVWEALLSIPYGETRSYEDIAYQIGSPKACRAVGGANNRNRIMIVVPCHRVIGKNGRLVGYACGIDSKELLLDIEKRNL
jgi:methylated-DNA-[protein]-cysteine S-methyltransferase